jgi:hypothetical protein
LLVLVEFPIQKRVSQAGFSLQRPSPECAAQSKLVNLQFLAVCLQRAGKETAFETPTFGLNKLSVYSFCCLGQFGRTFGRSFESTLTARIFSSFCAVVLINNETGDHIVARYRDCGMPGGRPGNST